MPLDPSQKLAGVLAPVFALRSKDDLGIGDTDCVRKMIDWCARHHFSLLQLLPINETGEDHSPYNAISSIALDPTTLEITPEVIPDLTAAAFRKLAAPSLARELRRGPICYRKVKELKSKLLQEAFHQFQKNHDARDTVRAKEFRSFIQANGDWIGDYALFRALMEVHGNPIWEGWPSEHRGPSQARSWILSLPPPQRKKMEDRKLFYAYVQWLLRLQWKELKQYGEKAGVLLMGDIPFGIGRYSADVWADRSLFDLQWSCGAPPETFFKPDFFTERWGQNWGIPLYRWNRMKEDNHAWWRSRIRHTAEIFHFFRIDHVLGFYRVYAFPWKPEDNSVYAHLSAEEARARAGDLPRFWPGDDQTPHQQWLNQQHGEELLRMVLEAAGSTGVVAEDLGMTPDYVRPSLASLGIPGFKIPLFERHPTGSYKNSNDYPPLSVVTPATHDHEPIAALWRRWQTAPEGPAEIRHLLEWIGWNPNDPPRNFTPELHAAILRKLLVSPSWLAVLMITDLFAQTLRFNVPGPMCDSNWTQRLEHPIEDFDRDPDLARRLQALHLDLPRK